MAHRRGSFRGRVGISDAQRRKKAWGGLKAALSPALVPSPTIPLDVSFTPTANPDFGSVSVNFTQGIPDESTILRVRGSLNMVKNVIAGVEILTVAYGMGVMETGALLQGAAPNPASPDGSNWDGWMFYRSLNSAVVDAASTMIDVKAMRKIQSGYSFFFAFGVYIMTTDDSVATTPIVATSEITARGLFLLP